MRAWYSAWAVSSAGVRSGLEVEHGPQVGQDVQAVQAQVVGGPAGAEGGGQVAVAGLVDLLDPGAEPGDGLLAVAGGEFPPGGRRAGLVAAGILTGGGVGGQAGEQGGEGGVVRGFAGVELGELLTAGGELVGQGGDRVVAGHGQFQGKPVPWPGISPAGTCGSGTTGRLAAGGGAHARAGSAGAGWWWRARR